MIDLRFYLVPALHIWIAISVNDLDCGIHLVAFTLNSRGMDILL